MAGLALSAALIVTAVGCGQSAPAGPVVPSSGTRQAGFPPASPFPPGAVLNVGLPSDLPGIGTFDPVSNSRNGFDFDLMNWLGNSTPPGFVPQPIGLRISDRESAIMTGRARLVVDNYSMTDERRKYVTFAGPYMITKQGIMVRSGEDRITDVGSLAHKSVCTAAGSTSYMQLAPLRETAYVTTAPGIGDCVNQLKAKQVEVVTTDQLVLYGFAAKDHGLEVEPIRFGQDERYGVALPKGDLALCQAVTDSLRNFLINSWDNNFRTNFPGMDPTGYKPPDPFGLDRCT